jgi:hypothetical protein
METIPNLVTVDLDALRDSAASNDLEIIADSLLEALDQSKTRATFFVPRWFADEKPESTRRVVTNGHEIACLSTEQPARTKPYCATFSGELDATRDAIESATGVRVRGHRNAAFAVDYESEWAYDVLVDRGYEYDSSRIPPKYADVRFPPVPRSVHAVRRWGGTLLEIPVSTADVLTMRVQLGTAGTIRGIPLPVWSALVEDRQVRGEPLVMHLRASELRRTARFSARSRATADKKTLERVSRITGRFAFTSVANALPELLRAAPIVET